MYIGVGTLFCVTLPAEIRYGIGVRMCAPSMPLPSDPRTRLSRVVPQDACFVHLDVRHAVLGEEALLLGNEQRRGVDQRDEAEIGFRSPPGRRPCATCTPPRKLDFTAAKSAAVPALVLRKARRSMPARLVVPLVFFVTCRPLMFGWSVPANKKAAARGAETLSPGQRLC